MLMLFRKIILVHFKKCTSFTNAGCQQNSVPLCTNADCQQNSVPLCTNRSPNVVLSVTDCQVPVVSFVIGYRQPSLVLQVLGSEVV